MNEKEALIRIKTGNFNNGYGIDMQLLVDTVGTIGEMFKSGQISEVVCCKDCKHHRFHPYEKIPYCSKHNDWGWKDDDFCSYAKRR